MTILDRAALEAAGFTEEPPPDMILVRAERVRHQPPGHADLGLVRVKYRMRWGGWSYDDVPESAIVTDR